MHIPTDYAVWVMAEQLRAYMQQTVKHLPCALPPLITCYFDESTNLVGYAATIMTDSMPSTIVGTIALLTPSEQLISYTPDGMRAQTEQVRAYLETHFRVQIHRTFAVHTEARHDYPL